VLPIKPPLTSVPLADLVKIGLLRLGSDPFLPPQGNGGPCPEQSGAAPDHDRPVDSMVGKMSSSSGSVSIEACFRHKIGADTAALKAFNNEIMLDSRRKGSPACQYDGAW
jgi:hypothetical protein